MQISPTGRRLTFTPEPQRLTFGRIVTEMRQGGYFLDADYSDLERRIEHLGANFPEEQVDFEHTNDQSCRVASPQ